MPTSCCPHHNADCHLSWHLFAPCSVPGIVLTALWVLTHAILTTIHYEVSTIIVLILQMRNLRSTRSEVTGPESHSYKGQGSHPGCPALRLGERCCFVWVLWWIKSRFSTKDKQTPHELIGTEKRLVVARGGGWVGMGEGGQKLQISSYTIKVLGV